MHKTADVRLRIPLQKGARSLNVALAAAMIWRPTGVEPVNDTLRRRRSLISGETMRDADEPVMTLHTPAGRPARSRMSASASIDSGVCLAGLTTIVHPAAIAGPILRVPIAIGKFHGVMSRHGPTGCFITRSLDLPSGAVEKRPSMRTASSANQRKYSAA